MKIGNVLKYNIRVIDADDNILYEGISDDSGSDIKELEYKEVVELNSSIMILRV